MKKREKIPEFDSLNEMANFWDDHNFVDFEDEFEAAPDVKIDIKNRRYLPISLKMYEKMERIAHQKGMSVERLIRTWVAEKLAEIFILIFLPLFTC